MESRALLSLVVFGIASATAGVGLYAFFSDTATSTGNLFDAATVVLKVNGQDNIGAFLTGSDLLPGESTSGSVTVRNDGSRGGAAVDLDIRVENLALTEGGYGYGYADGVDFARYVEIQSMTYGAASLTVADGNGNGFADLRDWANNNAATRDLADPGAGTVFAVTLRLHTSAPNDVQNDSLTFDVKFFLAQSGENDLTSP